MATPKYRQIADELREDILTGVLKLGDQIPTEASLQDKYEVSRNTVREAIRELIGEGLLVTEGRRGTRVRNLTPFVFNAQLYVDDDTYYEQPHPSADSWASQVIAAGRVPSQNFDMRITAVGSSITALLGLQTDDLVCIRECERSIDNVRWCDEVTYYPLDIAEACGLVTPHDIVEGTARRIADRGYVEVEYKDTIYGRPATPEEVISFGLQSGASVILQDRLAMLVDRPCRLTRQVFPMDRNRVRYALRAAASRRAKAGLQ